MFRDRSVFVRKGYRECISNIHRLIVDLKRREIKQSQKIDDNTGYCCQSMPIRDKDGNWNSVLSRKEYRNTECNRFGGIYMQVFAHDETLYVAERRGHNRRDSIARKTPAVVVISQRICLLLWRQRGNKVIELYGHQWLQYPDECIVERFYLTCQDYKL